MDRYLVISSDGHAGPHAAEYRAYVRELRGDDGSADRGRAARMPTRYVFPKRATTFAVLRHALSHDPDDATAHFLLGSLHLAGGRADSAMAHWERARALNSRAPQTLTSRLRINPVDTSRCEASTPRW